MFVNPGAPVGINRFIHKGSAGEREQRSFERFLLQIQPHKSQQQECSKVVVDREKDLPTSYPQLLVGLDFTPRTAKLLPAPARA
jgi:hypothetical protein